MSEPLITPAMTPEEWAKMPGFMARTSVSRLSPSVLHTAAARLLYGQPFGFTQEDVDDEITAAKWYEHEAETAPLSYVLSEDADLALCRELGARHRARAAKIAALLPPAP